MNKNELSHQPEQMMRSLKNLRQAGMRWLRKSFPYFVCVLLTWGGIYIYNLFFPPPKPLSEFDINTTVASILASATPAPAVSSQVYQIIRPSIILITTEDGENKEGGSLGSGVLISEGGEILTCLHVVDKANRILVTFADGTQADAKIVVRQPENDIAILQPDSLPSQIIPAILGDPNSMRIGDEAYAVGNPFGLYASMSAGVISGFDRSFNPENGDHKLTGLIQIDTAVNPGNSGGPLLNRYGEVIGIIEGIANPTGQDVFIGIGFAVPITGPGGALGSPLD